MLALRRACDEVAGIAQDAQLATAGQWDRIEGAGPALVRHQVSATNAALARLGGQVARRSCYE